MNWKIQTIENHLLKIHPLFKEVKLVDGELEVYFNDVKYPSAISSFIYKSETRILLEELEEILLEEEADEFSK